MYLNQCFHALALTFMVTTSDTAHSLDMSALGWWIRWEQRLEHGSVSYAITTCISCDLHLHRGSGLGFAGHWWCGRLYLNHCAWALWCHWARDPVGWNSNTGGSNFQRWRFKSPTPELTRKNFQGTLNAGGLLCLHSFLYKSRHKSKFQRRSISSTPKVSNA